MTKKTSIRKTIMLVLLVCLVLVYGGGALVACNSEGEQKTGSGGWLSDDTYHWREWKVYEGAIQIRDKAEHVYDDEYDEDCNVCGYVRDAEQNPEGPENPDNPDNPENPEDPDQHVHGLAWFNTDPQFHWQYYTCEHHADEQLNKDEHEYDDDQDTTCDVCGYVRTLHQHVWAWRYDESQHWEETTCTEHEPLTRYEGGHIYADGECEECGLEQAYAEVFQIYKTNAQFKGDEPQTFAAWMASLEEQGVDHVGKNAAGDGVFYMSEDDSEGELMYFAERNLTVRASAEGSAIEGVYFVLKAKVNGEYQEIDGSQVIASAATNLSGIARLTFIPTWGFSGDEVEYEIALATDEEVAGGKAHPVGIEVTESDPKTVVIGSEATGETTFEVKALIGGELGFLGDRKVGEAGATYYIADGIAEGWYLVTLNVVDGTVSGFNAATEADANTKLTVDGGETDATPTVNSGVATWIVKVKEASEFIKITRAAESSEVTFNVRMEAYETSPLALNKNNTVRVNSRSTNSEDWMYYSLSELIKGEGPMPNYYGWLTSAIDGTLMYQFSDTSSPTAFANYDFMALTVKGMSADFGTLSVAFVSPLAGLASTTTVAPFAVDASRMSGGDGEFDINFTEDATIAAMIMPMSEEAKPYHYKVTSEEAFTGVQLTTIDTNGSVAVVMPSNISATTEYVSAPVVLNSGDQFLAVFENVSGSNTKSLHLSFEEEVPEEIEVGVAKHVTFEGGGEQYFSFTVERYTDYVILANGEAIDGVKITDSANTISINMNINDSVAHASKYFRSKSAGNLLLTFTAENAIEFDVTIIKIDEDGTELTVGNETPVTFEEGARFMNFVVRSNDSLTDYLGVMLNSGVDLSGLKVITMYYANAASDTTPTVVEAVSPSPTEVTELTLGLANKLNGNNTRYVISVISEAAVAPDTFNIKVAKGLDASAINLKFRGNGSYVSEIWWSEVPNAEKYEVYECIKPLNSDPDNYKLVATVNKGEPLSYYNRTYVEPHSRGQQYYTYYIKAIDTDEEFLPAQSTNVGQSITDRKMFTITVNIPNTFEGWLPIAIYSSSGGSYNSLLFEKVEAGTTVVTIEVAIPNSGRPGVRIASKTDTALSQEIRDNLTKYDYKTNENTDFAENKATLSMIELSSTTITINLPENFPASTGAGYRYTYTRWTGKDKKTQLFTANELAKAAYFPVEEGQRTVTLTYLTVAYQEGQVDDFMIYTQYNVQASVTTGKMATGYTFTVEEATNDNGDTNLVVNVVDRIKAKFKVNLPEDFMAQELSANPSKNVSISVRIYPEDFSGTSYFSGSFTLQGEALTQAISQRYYMFEPDAYFAQGMKFGIELSSANSFKDKLNYGWEDSSASDYYTYRGVLNELGEETEHTYEVTVKDRVMITVNVKVDRGVKLAAIGDKKVFNYAIYKDNGSGQPDGAALCTIVSDNGTAGNLNSVWASFKTGTDPVTGMTTYALKIPMYDYGYEKYLFNINLSSTTSYVLPEKNYVPFTVDGKTATADYGTVESTSYFIYITADFPEDYPEEASETRYIYLYKDGAKQTTSYRVSVEKDSDTGIIEIAKANYSADSNYTLKADIFATDADITKVYTSDVMPVNFEGTKASMTVNIRNAEKSEYYVANVNITITGTAYNASSSPSMTVRLREIATNTDALRASVPCTKGETSITAKLLVDATSVSESDGKYQVTITGTGLSTGSTRYPHEESFTVDEAQRTITINITVKPVEA